MAVIVSRSRRGAVVVTLYGASTTGLDLRLQRFLEAGLDVVAVSNNDIERPGIPCTVLVQNRNAGGLAGGLNRGVEVALERGSDVITLLDQDSEVDADTILKLQQTVSANTDLVVGPAVWDLDRKQWHTKSRPPRMLITSGSTFTTRTWQRVGAYHDWMEIDYLDHEWCSRARQKRCTLKVIPETCLTQRFGVRHPNLIAHKLGLQLYSPYRRAIALRNLRWLIKQDYVPLDIRMKEGIKMLIKPWLWLIFEQSRLANLRSIRVGLMAKCEEAFPRHLLGTPSS